MNRCRVISLTIICMLALGGTGIAQNPFWDKVTVRRAFETGTSDDYLPARVSLTLPEHADPSFLINAGAGYGFERNSKLHSDLSAFGVYNRNTLTDYDQKNYKLGVSSNHSFDLSRNPLLAILGRSTLEYMHDYTARDHSILFTSYWQPLYKKQGSVHVGGFAASDHVVNYFLAPQLGIEHQQILSYGNTGSPGFDLRGYFSAGGTLIIKRKSYYSTADLREDLTERLLRQPRWNKKSARQLRDTVNAAVPDHKREVMEKRYWTRMIEVSINYTGRFSMVSHHSGFEPYIPLFTGSLNYYPTRSDDFSFGLQYSNGANPVDGTLKQSYWLLSINFRK